MKRWKRNAIIAGVVIYALGLAGWLTQDRIVRFLDERKLDDRGFVRRVLIDDHGTEHRYIVFVPHVDPPPDCDGYPVFFFLNGHGENGEDGLLQISNNFGRPVWEMQRDFPFLAVAPQCAEGGSWSREPDPSIALKILDTALSDYACDEDRVYLSGVSSGGAGLFQMLPDNADRFAAVVSVAATSHGDTNTTARLLQEKKLPIWLFYNGGDSPVVVDQNRSLHAALQSTGCDYLVTEYDRPGHDTWNYAYRDPAMYRWLLTKSRPINQTTATYQPINTTAVLELIQKRGSPRPASGRGAGGEGLLVVNETTSPQSQTPSSNAPTPGLRLNFKERQDFEVVFETTLAEPVYLTFEPGGSSESVSSHHVCLARPGQIVPRTTLHYESLKLSGSFAIRAGQWNTVSVSRSDESITASVNGWPIWSLLDGATDFTQLSIQHACPAQTEVSEEPQSISSLQRLRYRMDSTKFEIIVAEATTPLEIEATTLRTNGEKINRSAIELLQTRTQQALGKSLTWKSQRASEFFPSFADSKSERHVEVATDQTYFASQRIDDDPTRMNLAFARGDEASVVQFRPYMLNMPEAPSDFATAIANGFANRQPPQRNVKTFQRWIKANESIDFLDCGDRGLSKAVRRSNLLDDPASWARLSPEFDPTDQIDSLHQSAALLSLGRIDIEPFDVDITSLQQVASDQFVAGHKCEVFEEVHPDDDRYTRRFWIDLDAGGLIRRYYGKVIPPDESIEFEYGRPLTPMRGDLCIEIDYDDNGDPLGWTMVNGQSKECPPRFAAAGSVKSDGEISPGLANRWEQQLNKPNVWVVDKVQEKDYVTTYSGERRIHKSASAPSNVNLTQTGTVDPLSTTSVARTVVCLAGLVMVGIGFKRHRTSLVTK